MYNFSSPTQRNLPRSVGRTHGVAVGRLTGGIPSSKAVVTAEATAALMAWAPLSNGVSPQPSRCSGMGANLSRQTDALSSRVNAAQCGFSRNVPIPSSLYDVFQRGMSRPPAKKLPSFRWIGDEFRGVASTPRRFMNRNTASTHPFDGCNYLANGVTTSRAQVNGGILLALEHVP